MLFLGYKKSHLILLFVRHSGDWDPLPELHGQTHGRCKNKDNASTRLCVNPGESCTLQWRIRTASPGDVCHWKQLFSHTLGSWPGVNSMLGQSWDAFVALYRYIRDQHTFRERRGVNTLDFMSCTVSVATTQPCLCGAKAAVDKTKWTVLAVF